MTTMADLVRFMAAENALVTLCRGDLTTLWGQLGGLMREERRDALLELFPALVSRYADMSAAHGADFYDDLRFAALGARASRYSALAQDGVPVADLEEAVRETARYLWSETPDKMLTALMDRSDLYVKQGARNTMLQSARRDPAKPKFGRVPVGETCSFCRSLAGHGFYYHSPATAGELNKYHPDCDCMIVPGWEDQVLVGYDPAVYVKEWKDSADAPDNGAPNDFKRRLAAMRKGTDENAYHPRTDLPKPPWILRGGSADWPPWLQPLSAERWDHILREHGSDSSSGKPKFKADTDIAQAVFDTIVHGQRTLSDKTRRYVERIINDQLIRVAMRRGDTDWFIATAHPVE